MTRQEGDGEDMEHNSTVINRRVSSKEELLSVHIKRCSGLNNGMKLVSNCDK